MRRALGLAVMHRPHPNPRVGALVVAGGRVIAEAAHERPGAAHAEAAALATAGAGAAGATLVVTLEPCVHHGRTPPCVDAIIGAGVSRVVVGALDPDARVAGRGVAALRSAGVIVDTGVIAAEIEAADAGYFHHRRTGRPLITLKLAMTLDGQAAAADGTSQWITSTAAREDAHRLRAEADAVIVGAGTLRADDPQLTVRIPGYAGPQPRPVIIAGHQPLPASRRVYAREPIVYAPRTPDTDGGDQEVVVLAGTDGVDLGAMVKHLGSEGIVSALVEGGPTVAAGFVTERLVDRYVFYLAGLLGGGTGRPALPGAFATLADAARVDITAVETIGSDIKISGRPGAPEGV